ncbi:hypothetical protein D9M68_333550 [compost metagenome]
MRAMPAAAALLMLCACASPLPQPDPRQAWVDLYAPAIDLLMADRLDRRYWPDGRYFQVSPGAHELEARFRFEVHAGMAIAREPLQITCAIRVRYDGFVAGQRYLLEARSLGMEAQAWLYDSQRNVLARGEVTGCGSF